MIDTIIFDIGNVLLDFDYLKHFRQLFDEDTAQAIADATVRDLAVWLEMDRGVLSYEEALALVVRGAPHLSREIRCAVDYLYGNVESYPYATHWVKQLKEKGYRVYFLSNYGEKPFAESKDRMPFLDQVDGWLLSCEIREVKPSPIIYQTLCSRFAITPDRAVFIDDSAINVAGAQAVGMHTIHFTTYQDALTQLRALPLAYGL